jgi:hypothetical protein
VSGFGLGLETKARHWLEHQPSSNATRYFVIGMAVIKATDPQTRVSLMFRFCAEMVLRACPEKKLQKAVMR